MIRRAVRLVVHNWPLKLAAIALATLLYAGLVASQDSSVFPGPVPVTAVNQPPGTVVTNHLRDVDADPVHRAARTSAGCAPRTSGRRST